MGSTRKLCASMIAHHLTIEQAEMSRLFGNDAAFALHGAGRKPKFSRAEPFGFVQIVPVSSSSTGYARHPMSPLVEQYRLTQLICCYSDNFVLDD